MGFLEVEPLVDGWARAEPGTWSHLKVPRVIKCHKSPVWQREKDQLDGIRIPLLSGDSPVLSNVAMENHNFIVYFPIKSFIFSGFPVAMFDYRKVTV